MTFCKWLLKLGTFFTRRYAVNAGFPARTHTAHWVAVRCVLLFAISHAWLDTGEGLNQFPYGQGTSLGCPYIIMQASVGTNVRRNFLSIASEPLSMARCVYCRVPLSWAIWIFVCNNSSWNKYRTRWLWNRFTSSSWTSITVGNRHTICTCFRDGYARTGFICIP